MVTGVVASFDEDRGWGAIRRPGEADLPFHCTAISDGSRHISEGVPVIARVAAGHNGRWEATEVAILYRE